jgi:1-acyl-sn-glycerol-3-phosphate acyltransferase
MTGNALYTGGQVLCRIFSTMWFDLQVQGIRNVPLKGGVLIVANHQSYLDPMLAAVRLTRPMTYFAKSELFENKYFNWLIRSLGAFPVRQGEGDVGAVREAITKLKEGRALVLFPEGSRTDDGELLPIEGGVGLIARKAGVPVVPCIIEGSYKSWPRETKVFKPANIDIWYGKPIDPNGMKAAAIVQTIDRTFHQMQADVRADRVRRGRAPRSHEGTKKHEEK